jgi:hypothetical protein|tara:strand:+ start:820 stop:996 length:177 start_codon:yes stop_codon:yes gene_type:complete
MSGFGRKKAFILREIKMEYYNEKPATRIKKNRLKIKGSLFRAPHIFPMTTVRIIFGIK